MNCSVCLIDHDDATHAATLRIRATLRARMALVLTPVKPGKKKSDAAPCSPLEMIGYAPQREHRQFPPCACGGKHYAKGKCKACYDRMTARKRRVAKKETLERDR